MGAQWGFRFLGRLCTAVYVVAGMTILYGLIECPRVSRIIDYQSVP